MSTSYSPKIVTDGLVLALDAANRKSYVSGSTTWTDLSGNNNSGSLTNGPTFSGENGGSIVFDGTDDFVNVSYPTTLNNAPSFTLECMVKTDTPASALTTTYRRIIAYTSGSQNVQLGLAIATDSERIFYVLNSVGSVPVNYSVANIPTGSIYHVTATFDGISTYQMYLNGIAAPNKGASSFLIAATVNANTFFIGQRGNATAYLSGSIYNVKIYNKALSPNEVLQNFNATHGRFGV